MKNNTFKKVVPVVDLGTKFVPQPVRINRISRGLQLRVNALGLRRTQFLVATTAR